MQDELIYRLLKTIAGEPDVPQRTLAERLGVSLGKVNYCMHALIDKGWGKMENFRHSNAKGQYLYKRTDPATIVAMRLTPGSSPRNLAGPQR